jgi:hypothetical protein
MVLLSICLGQRKEPIMPKPLEYCPNCASMREMVQSLGMLADNRPGEESFIFHFHCASCNSYVRSTTLDYQEIIFPIEVAVISVPEYV